MRGIAQDPGRTRAAPGPLQYPCSGRLATVGGASQRIVRRARRAALRSRPCRTASVRATIQSGSWWSTIGEASDLLRNVGLALIRDPRAPDREVLVVVFQRLRLVDHAVKATWLPSARENTHLGMEVVTGLRAGSGSPPGPLGSTTRSSACPRTTRQRLKPLAEAVGQHLGIGQPCAIRAPTMTAGSYPASMAPHPRAQLRAHDKRIRPPFVMRGAMRQQLPPTRGAEVSRQSGR